MEARYAIRKRQLLDECQVFPEIFAHVIPRLCSFRKPFVTSFQGQVGDQHAKTYVCGLGSNLARQNVASIAYRFDHSRLPWQACMGWEEWDDEPLRLTLRPQGKTHLGQGDGELVFDPAGFPQSGRQSVGVARPWGGRLGKVDTCQVAMYLGSVSSKGHTLVDPRLFLPKAWTKDTARLDKAGVPNASRAQRTRHQVAWERLAQNGAGWPQGWMSGDDEMGRPQWFRRRRATLGERSWLAVPSHTARRDLETEPPEQRGQGRRPRPPWQSVEAWSQALGAEAWHSIDVRDGRKGPLGVAAVKRRMRSRPHRRQPGEEERLVVIRYRDRDQQEGVKVEYDLSNAPPATPVWALARVAKAAHRMAECMQRSTSEAGLADYAGRHWTGWQPHHTRSLRATGFLVRETARGKKMDPCDDLTADAPGHRDDCARSVAVRHHAAYAQGATEATATSCACSLLSLETA